MFSKRWVKLQGTLVSVVRESVLISQISYFYLGNIKKKIPTHLFTCLISCNKILEEKVASKLSKENILEKYFNLYSLQNQLLLFSCKVFFGWDSNKAKHSMWGKVPALKKIPGLPSSGFSKRLLFTKKLISSSESYNSPFNMPPPLQKNRNLNIQQLKSVVLCDVCVLNMHKAGHISHLRAKGIIITLSSR